MSVGPGGEYPRLERPDAKGEPPALRQPPLLQTSPDGILSVRFKDGAATIVDSRTGRADNRVPMPRAPAPHYLLFEGWLKDAHLFRYGSAPEDSTRDGLPFCNLWVTRLLDPPASGALDASLPDPIDRGMFLSDRCEYWTLSTGAAGGIALVPGRGNEVDFFDGPSVHAITRLKTGRNADTALRESVFLWRDKVGMLVIVYGISVPPAVVQIDLERRVVVSASGPSNDSYEENALCQSDVAHAGVEHGPRCRTRPPGQ